MTGLEPACLVAAVLAVLLGTHHWRRRRHAELAAPLAVIMFAGACWSLLQLVLVWFDTDLVRVVVPYAILPTVGAIVASTVVYALVLTGHGHRVDRRLLAVVAVEPVALLLVAAGDPRRGLVFAEVGTGADGAFTISFGPAFWVHTAYSYGLIALSGGLMIRALLGAVAGHRTVLATALVGMLLPLAGNVVYLAGAGPDGVRIDLAPVMFLLTAVIWSWAAWFRRRLEAMPVSTRDVLHALGDAVVVVDASGTVLDANPAARRLLAGPAAVPADPVGRRWDTVVDPELAALLAGTDQRLVTLGDGNVLDVRIERLTTGAGLLRAAIVVARDVTELERLRGELAELAVRDGLTGLFNRRYLTEALGRALAAADDDAPLAVVMLDADRFKRVNDSHGHAVGDEVLVQLAALLTEHARPADVVARSGGEEFVVLMPATSLEAAAAWSERVRASCGSRPLPTQAGPLRLTVSIGVAESAAEDSTATLLGRADRALYAAKAAGRDRVQVARGAADVPRPHGDRLTPTASA